MAGGRQGVQGEQGQRQGAGDGGEAGQGQAHGVGQGPVTLPPALDTGHHLVTRVTRGAGALLDGDGGGRGGGHGGGQAHRLTRKTQTGAREVGGEVGGERGGQTHARLSLNDCHPGSTHLKWTSISKQLLSEIYISMLIILLCKCTTIFYFLCSDPFRFRYV